MACIQCAVECSQIWSDGSRQGTPVPAASSSEGPKPPSAGAGGRPPGPPSPPGHVGGAFVTVVPSAHGDIPLPNQPPEEMPSASGFSQRGTPEPGRDSGAGGLAAYLERAEALSSREGGSPAAPVSEEEEELQEELCDREAKNWRQHLYLLLEDPDSSLVARVLSHCMLLTIVLSIAGFILQTLPSVQDFAAWDIIEIGSTVIFTMEYVLRFLVCNAFGDQTRLGFVRLPMNILDVLAILPFYVERSLESLELKPFRVLRSARLIRIFRIFKLSKYSLGMNLMVESLVNSVHPLSILAFFLCIGVLLFSALLYYAERTFCPTVRAEDWQAYQAECMDSSSGRARNGDLCCNEHNSAMGFPSIRQTFWWSIVTMTTVGYGDMVPRTSLGRLVAGLAMLSGIILISLPVAIVGAKFQTAYEEFELDREEMLLLEEEAKQSEALAVRSPSWKKLSAVMKMMKARDTPTLSSKVAKDKAAFVENERRRSQADARRSTSSMRSAPKRAKKHSCSPILEAFGQLTGQLKALESRRAMSPAAQEQIQLLLELFEHVERAERQLAGLREKDAALNATIRADFAALARRYDTALAAELSSS